MKFGAVLIALFVGTAGGCTYYQTGPGTYSTTPTSGFDRSWGAAIAAFADQGVPITREDRGAGVLSGSRDGLVITALIRTQADGSVRVEFNSSGATSRDPGLVDRVSQAYNRSMGR